MASTSPLASPGKASGLTTSSSDEKLRSWMCSDTTTASVAEAAAGAVGAAGAAGEGAGAALAAGMAVRSMGG